VSRYKIELTFTNGAPNDQTAQDEVNAVESFLNNRDFNLIEAEKLTDISDPDNPRVVSEYPQAGDRGRFHLRSPE
jgi:hypothetical protein